MRTILQAVKEEFEDIINGVLRVIRFLMSPIG